MSSATSPDEALASAATLLTRLGRRFAVVGGLPVAAAEELVSMKVLSMTEARLQDRLDAQRLLQHAEVDLERVRANLLLIAERRCDRDQDLEAKLEVVLRAVDRV